MFDHPEEYMFYMYFFGTSNDIVTKSIPTNHTCIYTKEILKVCFAPSFLKVSRLLDRPSS